MSVRVLVVDDDEVSREVLSVLLQGEGYQTEAVDSGEAALMYLKMVRPLPEVVLADMQMPGTSGDELARRMRETCGAGTVLLAMSGSELEGDAGREFDGFLLKPLSMEELAAAIAGGTAARERRQKDAGVTVLDEAVYGKLSAAMRPVKLNELYALCVNDAEARIGRMREAATDGEDGAYRREAHALQGGCGMVGAREMQALATSLEQRGLRGDHVASLDELTMACERLRRILIEHAGGHIRTEVSGDDTR
jgi:CheY-like chemotaxis protein